LNCPNSPKNGGEGTRRPVLGREVIAQSQTGTKSLEDRKLKSWNLKIMLIPAGVGG